MSDPSDMFDYAMQELLYNGRSGAVVDSDTSRERADREDRDGTTAERVEAVLRHLRLRPEGMTWAQLGAVLKLHHGQISGCLSMMHKAGLVFCLRKKVDRCHPYVAAEYRDRYSSDQRIDAPARTKASQDKDALQQLLRAVDDLLQCQTWETIRALKSARALYSPPEF